MHDIRYAIRVLAARPGFSAVAILTLALGIGANTAIFTVVNAVLLRPLPLPDADRLVMIAEHAGAIPTTTTSWQNYADWRDSARSYAGFGAVRSLTMTMTGTTEPERLPAKMVAASLLGALGTAPALGRTLAKQDDRPGAAGVALLSDALWRRRFGASADAIGRPITLDGEPYTIVGVMPPRFQILAQADVFVPIGPWAATLPDDRGWHPGLWPIARLKPGVTLQQAQAELDVISARLAAQYPLTNHNVTGTVTPLHDYAVQNVRQSLLVLVAAVGLVLLIACVNVANLLLARAVGRRKEIAVRTAVGATPRHIAAQLLAESLVLAIAGGGGGLLLAQWTLPVIAAFAATSAPGAAAIGSLDATALVFTLAVSVATGCMFGLVPVCQTARLDLSRALGDSGRGSGAGAGHRRLRGLFVVAEMAMATILLIAAVLLTRSLARLQDVAIGFSPSGLLMADAPLAPTRYGAASERNRLVDNLLPRLRDVPGVKLAAVATSPPFDGAGMSLHFNIAGLPPKGPEEFIISGYRGVTESYFATLGIRLIAGRTFTNRDRDDSVPVAIVNETLVRRFFAGNRDAALRSRVQLGGLPNADAPVMDIVGIVGDTKQAFEAALQPTMFVPYLQPPIDLLDAAYRNLSIVLKTDGSPASLAPALRAVVRDLDRDQPLARVRTMTEAMADSVTEPRGRTTLLMLLSGVALALSLIGVYGVMAYAVSERSHELGVRIALGASRANVLALVMGQGARLVCAGIGIGLVGAAVASRALRSLLFGIGALDPATFAIAAAALAIAAAAATYLPARRASDIDPLGLLR